jgi:hypothetical protein
MDNSRSHLACPTAIVKARIGVVWSLLSKIPALGEVLADFLGVDAGKAKLLACHRHWGVVAGRSRQAVPRHGLSKPITELAKNGGDQKDQYVYIVYPGELLSARPPRPIGRQKILRRAQTSFSPLGAAFVKKIFS